MITLVRICVHILDVTVNIEVTVEFCAFLTQMITIFPWLILNQFSVEHLNVSREAEFTQSSPHH